MRMLCPACNKENDASPTCRRCGADLATLHAIRESALWHLAEGRRCLTLGRGDEALVQAQTSWDLRHDGDAAGLAFLACLLMARFDEATRWYRLGARFPIKPDPLT